MAAEIPVALIGAGGAVVVAAVTGVSGWLVSRRTLPPATQAAIAAISSLNPSDRDDLSRLIVLAAANEWSAASVNSRKRKTEGAAVVLVLLAVVLVVAAQVWKPWDTWLILLAVAAVCLAFVMGVYRTTLVVVPAKYGKNLSEHLMSVLERELPVDHGKPSSPPAPQSGAESG